MRVQIDDLPRIRSTRMSSTARCSAACACRAFQRSRPASAAASLGEFATTTSGILVRVVRGFCAAGLAALDAREGATREGSPSALRKWGGQGASPSAEASSLSASSSKVSSDPSALSISAWGSPLAAKRAGMVSTVKSAGSQSVTSCQWSGAETRASGTGRTEYAEHVVRSFAFWL